MLIPQRKLRENRKLTYTSRMTTPAWKPNRIFSFCEEWDDQGNGEIIPRPTLLCSLSQHQYSRFAFHRRPALLSFKLKKLARKHVSSFYFLSEPPPRTGLVSPLFFSVFSLLQLTFYLSQDDLRNARLGVPIAAQQNWIWQVSMRMQVWSLALLSG